MLTVCSKGRNGVSPARYLDRCQTSGFLIAHGVIKPDLPISPTAGPIGLGSRFSYRVLRMPADPPLSTARLGKLGAPKRAGTFHTGFGKGAGDASSRAADTGHILATHDPSHQRLPAHHRNLPAARNTRSFLD